MANVGLKFTVKEMSILLDFLGRSQISGGEANMMAYFLNKITAQMRKDAIDNTRERTLKDENKCSDNCKK